MSKVANIKFNGGIIHTPSDVSPIDGDLNECINLVPSDGELKPIEQPEKVMADSGNQLQLDGTLAAVHQGAWGRNYVSVVSGSGSICIVRFSNQNGSPMLTREFDEPVRWVQCMGSLVTVGVGDKTVYFAFKNGGYQYLGSMPPFVKFRFYLDEGELISEDSPRPYTKTAGDTIEGIPLSFEGGKHRLYGHDDNELKENRDIFGKSVYSKIAALENEAKENGEFLNPFFLRYAMKLYDGSYVNVSQPFLMIPSTYKNPFMCRLHKLDERTVDGSVSINTAYEELLANPSCIRYCQENISEGVWDDLISSIDVFVTNPIYQYKEKYIVDNEYENPVYPADVDLGHRYGLEKSQLKSRLLESMSGTEDIWSHGGQQYAHFYFYDLPSIPENKIDDAVKDNEMIFYHVKSFDYKELIGASGVIGRKLEIDDDVLPNLATRKTLEDSNSGVLNDIAAKASLVYNSRMIIGNLIQKLSYYPHNVSFPPCETMTVLGMKFLINDKRSIKCIEAYAGAVVPKYITTDYIYMPKSGCTRVLYRTSDGYFSRNLESSNHLDGSYVYSGLKSFFEAAAVAITQGEYDSYTNDNEFEYESRIAVSAVSNPFSFPTLNMIEVGTRQILGLATYALPMSQGQFGQYPVVVFSEDGIRSLGINGDGTIGSVAPVSSADALTGFAKPGRPNVISDGQSLYFITKRGLMEMRGLQVRCVSEVLNGRTWKYSDYRDCVNPNQGKVQYQNIVMLFGDGIKNSQTFNQAISNPNNPAFLAFDYKHNRILVTNPSLRAHWLYSITDHKWCKMIFNDNYKVDDKSAILNISQMMSSGLINVKNPNDAVDGRDIVSAVFDWNASYLQTSDGELWDLMGAPDENDDAYYKYGFIASRPIRLGSDEHKSIIRLLHRERINSHYGFRGMRLYGSVDGIRFYEITSLRGASYKYFVVLLYTCMKANERYSYMSVEFEERFQNKLR